MYAVFKTGGKQYRAAPGEVVTVEKLTAGEGEAVEFDQVLMVTDGEAVTVGTPYIKGGKVLATVKNHGRGKKIEIIKFKRRKHHLKRMGHRQDFSQVEITEIKAS